MDYNSTQIFPVVKCSRPSEVRDLMKRLGAVRADTYNKLGSLKGWGIHWKAAAPIIRAIKHHDKYGLPSKLFEWTVSDVVKCIKAQQEAAKVYIIRAISWRNRGLKKCPNLQQYNLNPE